MRGDFIPQRLAAAKDRIPFSFECDLACYVLLKIDRIVKTVWLPMSRYSVSTLAEAEPKTQALLRTFIIEDRVEHGKLLREFGALEQLPTQHFAAILRTLLERRERGGVERRVRWRKFLKHHAHLMGWGSPARWKCAPRDRPR
jgi:hypothetical protein